MIASPLIVHPCAIDAGAFSMLATDSRFPSFEQVAIQATSTENGTDIRFDNFLADQGRLEIHAQVCVGLALPPEQPSDDGA